MDVELFLTNEKYHNLVKEIYKLRLDKFRIYMALIIRRGADKLASWIWTSKKN
jgi:hypothetical protein